MTAVRTGDLIVVGRRGMRVFPPEAEMRRARPVRVHGEPGVEREAEGGERPRDRRGDAEGEGRRGRRSSPCSARRSSTPAAANWWSS